MSVTMATVGARQQNDYCMQQNDYCMQQNDYYMQRFSHAASTVA
jgi:hypothetical protein